MSMSSRFPNLPKNIIGSHRRSNADAKITTQGVQYVSLVTSANRTYAKVNSEPDNRESVTTGTDRIRPARREHADDW